MRLGRSELDSLTERTDFVEMGRGCGKVKETRNRRNKRIHMQHVYGPIHYDNYVHYILQTHAKKRTKCNERMLWHNS